jgi:DNA-binding transcriptional LysR family regulator
MISRQLIRTDLNLLVALQVLLEERNVTRAAERLGVSQPALSKTLQKLRDTFQDELFTRTAHGLIPTPRAEALSAGLPPALTLLDALLEKDEFEPASYEGTFRIVVPPIFAEVLLPPLLEQLSREAPGVDIITSDVGVDFQDRLKRAEIDFAIQAVRDTERDILAEPLKVIRPCCYMRRGHPLAERELSLKEFLSFPHVRLYLPGATRENLGLVDEVLAERGLYRRVVLDTTQFAPAIAVLARTDCLLIANAALASNLSLSDAVQAVAPPAELERLLAGYGGGSRSRLALLRHTRSSNSAPHQWLRGLIVQHLSEPGPDGGPSIS